MLYRFIRVKGKGMHLFLESESFLSGGNELMSVGI
jgi:hypothetical protein